MMNKDAMQRNVEAVKRLQQFIATISATFRLMAADIDRLLQDLSQPLHEIARVEQAEQEAAWLDRPAQRSLRHAVKNKKKPRRRKRTA